MGLGVGFRVAPGVRLRVSTRGPRLSVGPRLARVHVGGGRTAVSSGAGSLTTWTTLSGGGRRPGQSSRDLSPPTTSGTNTQKLAEWLEVKRRHTDLVDAHLTHFELARRPETPMPQPPHRLHVRDQLLAKALKGVPVWSWPQRREARRAVERSLEGVVREHARQINDTYRRQQQDADAWWERLAENDGETVIERIAVAYADNDLPAEALATAQSSVLVAVALDGPDALLGEREADVTARGKPSLKKMSKTRRNDLFAEVIWSQLTAACAEALAVAPGLEEAVGAAIVVTDNGPVVVALLEAPRAAVTPVGSDRVLAGEDLQEALAEGRIRGQMVRAGRTREVVPLSASDYAEVATILDHLDTD